MDIKRYIKFTLPLLILFFIFVWVIIPNFLPALMIYRSKICIVGFVFFIILGDIVDLTDPNNQNNRRNRGKRR